MYFYVIVYLASYFVAAIYTYLYKNKDKLFSSGYSQISQKVSNIHRCHIYMRTYQNTQKRTERKRKKQYIVAAYIDYTEKRTDVWSRDFII